MPGHRPAAVPGGLGDGYRAPGHRATSRSRRAGSMPRAPRSGDDLPEVPGEGAGTRYARPRRWARICVDSWLASHPGAAGGPGGTGPRWCRRNKVVAALLAVCSYTSCGSVAVTVALIYALRAKDDLGAPAQPDHRRRGPGKTRRSRRPSSSTRPRPPCSTPIRRST